MVREAPDLVQVHPVPAAERPLADRFPELTFAERRAATAGLVLRDASFPEMEHLSESNHPGVLAEDPFEDGGAATAGARDEHHWPDGGRQRQQATEFCSCRCTALPDPRLRSAR